MARQVEYHKWLSKIVRYERPLRVTGSQPFKRYVIGVQKKPKSICKDRDTGTGKAQNMERLSLDEMLIWKRRNNSITYLNLSESRGTVPMKL